jgi:osmotically-inducible protein OsmY
MIPRWFASTVLVVLAASALSGCIAAAAVGTAAGVQTLRQERTVGNALDDRAIKTEVDGKLRATPGLRFGIATTVVEGRVLLAGRVTKPEQRLDATRAAWERSWSATGPSKASTTRRMSSTVWSI